MATQFIYITPFGRSLVDDTDAATARATLGAGTSSFSGAFPDLTSKPTTLSGYGITDAAPLASPTLTGVPAAPTAVAGTSTTQIATTAFVSTALRLIPQAAAFGLGKLQSLMRSYFGITQNSLGDIVFRAGAILQPSGRTGLTITGGVETTSQPLISATQTWNSSGTTFAGFRINITRTAQASDSKFFDIQSNGVSVFYLDNSGSLFLTGLSSGNLSINGTINSSIVQIASSGTLQFSDGATYNTRLTADGSCIVAQRNSTSAQVYRVYNTFTSSTSYERFTIDWQTSANVCMLGTEKGSGGGTARVLQINYGGTTTAAITVPITSGAIVFGGDVTSTGPKANLQALQLQYAMTCATLNL